MAKYGVRQIDLSRNTKIPTSTLNDYLNGVIPRNINHIIQLIQFFEVSFNELIFAERTIERQTILLPAKSHKIIIVEILHN